ncbi:MAG TPA: SHOCT domain-containing protein [Bacteroidia bacterium]|nr:SHOCT domain-containing protein [Bacteroidia bacterium]
MEKLGKLRNAGILSEEEFIFQKQLILGNSS